MDTKAREKEFKLMFDAIDKFCRTAYQDLIITIRDISDDVIYDEILLFDGNNSDWVWENDWDEGQEFEFIGLTPLDDVSTKYIYNKYYEELSDDSVSEWCLRPVENLTALTILYCEKCGGETINRTPHCPYCGRNMTNASFKSRRDNL